MKVAIIHYWLVTPRGGERVVEALCEIFPQADIVTHLYDPFAFKKSIISQHRIITTFINRLPFAKKFYQKYLPLMPLALEQINLQKYDLIISSESGPAKGIIPPPGTPHICYCHSPMRYAWDMYYDYMARTNKLMRFFSTFILHYIRRWDQLTSTQVTSFVANSNFVASRIYSFYRRSAQVIHPPVNVEHFGAIEKPTRDYYLFFGQLVAYKKPEIAVEAFNHLGKPLVIAGDGEERSHLEKQAKSNIRFTGRVSDSRVKSLLQNAKALVFPGKEDFGIVLVEAMACGTPVVALGKGGALDSVIHKETGYLYDDCSSKGLIEAIEQFELIDKQLEPTKLISHSQKFSKQQFKTQMEKLIQTHANNSL